ncbi:MAG TPA: acyl-CoA synthetase [Gammaproteobacteria bacterium]|nr:acyl-CoA synthetase [Gammaproteobacteria bacterium]HBK12494.1 acyl-CoA synthetase [Gammaproteobacteria bacterium]|tara:strand:+ start:5269 stop:6915 length:1647 start_codon:yes stop_codon:yes gene_type:complete
MSIYEQGLAQNLANFTPLSPLSLLRRAASIYPDKTAVIQHQRRLTWGEVFDRCQRFAAALSKRGIGKGDTVAILSANTPEMFEAHFAIPMAGAVLNAINMRLDAATVSFILQHGEAKLLLVDKEFGPLAESALELMSSPPEVVHIDDPNCDVGHLVGANSYDDLLAEGDASGVGVDAAEYLPDDEWDAIALNYTSGTTGNPKGVVYHHRGAYLNALSNALSWHMGDHPVYLWTLPMFHCNGWCFPWTLAANAGVSVCLRQVRDDAVYKAMAEHRVTHFCGAPIVLNTLLAADEQLKSLVTHEVKVMTAGAPPPAAIIQGMQAQGIDVTHVYGLTETYGPVTLCAWREDLWGTRDAAEQAELKARQGVGAPMLEGLMVADPETLQPVPMDGKTMGEVMMRGNNVMKGYLKNPQATAEAFAGGWFHSGDLAVWFEDGYIKIMDRSKDIIISGGENISSIEIEDVLYRHPSISEAAVVARSDEKWGETPCAFVTLVAGAEPLTEQQVIDYCADNLARFKLPKAVVFMELPKTSTGKVQKFALREIAEGLQK